MALVDSFFAGQFRINEYYIKENPMLRKIEICYMIKKEEFFEMSSGRIIVIYKSNFDFYKSTTVLDDYLYRSDCTKN